ncbi:C2 domain profile [Nakaseomyces glabratus]
MVDEASTSGYKSSQHDEGIMFKGIGEITMSSSRETQDDMLKADKKEADGDIKEIAAKQELKVSKNIQVSAGDLVDEFERQRKRAAYVGWKQMGGWEEKDELTLEDELMDANSDTLLNNVLPEPLYGDWYHNVAIYFLAGVLSFAVGHFKFSLAPVFFITLFSALYYRTSAKKNRASIRELVQKEFTVQKIEDDYESLEWLNTLLDKYWPIIEPAVSQMVCEQVNDILATNDSIPAFIKALWIAQFTLGIKPPRVDYAKTFPNTDSDVVVMDWGLSFTPHDLSDLNAKQMKNYVNQKILVKAKLFGMTIPVTVANVAFKAKTRIRFKLMTPFPHVETINIQLLEIPDIDFVANFMGNNLFGWEILAIPGLMPLAKALARKYAGPILLPPFSLQLNVPQLVSESPLSVGVLEITVKNATDLKRVNNMIDTSVDPYITFEMGGKEVARTRTVRDTLNPVWNETIYMLLPSFTDPMTITVYDRREKLKDKILGRIEYNANSLHDKPTQRNVSQQFLRNSKPVGKMTMDLRFFPTLSSKKLPDGTVEDAPDLNTGLAKIIVDEGSSIVDKDGSASVEVYFNSTMVLSTAKGSPKRGVITWGDMYEAIITDRRKARFRFVVKDKNGEKINSTLQSLSDLIDRTQIGQKNIPLAHGNARLTVTTYWKPVMLDVGNKSIAYTPPIGALRVFVNKASNLKNLEKIGKIDPYAKILVNGIQRGRTDFDAQTTNPVWNTGVYVALTSPNQRITLECMDVETSNKDRTLGQFDIKLNDFFQKNSLDRYDTKVDSTQRQGRLTAKKFSKGVVTYSISFYPTLPVLTLEEIQDIESAEKRKAKLDEKRKLLTDGKLSKEEKQKLEEEELEIKEIEEMHNNKRKLSLDQLLEHKIGILAISVLSGDVPDIGVYVQSFFDGNAHARFISPKLTSRTINSGWTGDVMIKELDNSVVTFKVTRDKFSGKTSDKLCDVTLSTIDLLRESYYKPSILTLSGQHTAKLMLQVQWFPMDIEDLPPEDLMSNSGDLTIIAKNAENLLSADTNGYSDPFLKFYYNDEDDACFKTKTIKKTLNPTWNEKGVIEVRNRVYDVLYLKVMDWDAASADDVIGRATIPLSKIDPHNTTTLDVPVVDDEGRDGGIVHLEFQFSPRFVTLTDSEQKTVADAPVKSIGSGLKAGTTVVSSGLGSVGKIGKGIGRGLGLKKSKKHNEDD